MYPPIFEVAASNAAVKTALGTNPVRFFSFGLAPEGVADPYAVWQIVGGSPENYLADKPDMDGFTVQIDVYGASVTTVRSAVKALRDALESHAYVASWRGETRDPETKRYRSSFDMSWLTSR